MRALDDEDEKEATVYVTIVPYRAVQNVSPAQQGARTSGMKQDAKDVLQIPKQPNLDRLPQLLLPNETPCQLLLPLPRRKNLSALLASSSYQQYNGLLSQ